MELDEPRKAPFPGLVRHYQLAVLLFAAITFLSGVISPPALMDDVDAVQATIARTMLVSGDYVTARLDGIVYLEKAPLKYWLIAGCYRVFGVHDWAARLPIALSAILLCWLVARMACWAFDPTAGLYAGLTLSTCVGLFLFTRVLIPDIVLTLFITLSLWGLLRALTTGESDAGQSRSRWWARLFWAAMALGVLTKGLIAAVFPIGAAIVFLAASRNLFRHETWRRILPVQGVLLFLLIAAPWHVLATLANPPYLDFTMHAERGAYHGFFWFYLINEHVLRFLNLRYPRDYNTVPRPLFWVLHLVWLFPWSVYLDRAARLTYRAPDRASRLRLLALCWIGTVMIFFTFSTTQEYYSLPCYPAIALLLGSAMAAPGLKFRPRARIAGTIAAIAGLLIAFLLWNVRNLPHPGDIAHALSQNPDVYTLSLGHMADLTFAAFAYLKAPLAVALLACLVGAAGTWLLDGRRAIVALAVMMVIFFQGARMALQVFDPYMGSKGLADALNASPPGKLIVDDQYYAFSSVFFYANTQAKLLNGRVNNVEYGSYAPGAPNVFLTDPEVPALWSSPDRWYMVADAHQRGRLNKLLGPANLHEVTEAGGKLLLSNH